MKATTLISELAKVIASEGDRNIKLCINTGEASYRIFEDVDARVLGVSLDPETDKIEIYGE